MDTQFSYENFEKGMVSVEGMLNRFGYIPVISTASGATRAVMGKLTLVYSLLGAAYHAVASCVSLDTDHIVSSGRCLTIAGNGLGNMGRALIEAVPLVNLLTLVYDLADLRISYRAEQEEPMPKLELPVISQEIQYA